MRFGFRFRDLLFRRKLTALMALTSTVTLILTGAAWIMYDARASRENLVEEVSIIARTVGQNIASAIDLDQHYEVGPGLDVLSYHGPIRRAFVFDEEQNVLGSFYSEGVSRRLPAPEYRSEGNEFTSDSLYFWSPIYMDGERLGVLFVDADLRSLDRRRYDIASIVLLVLGFSTAIAFLVANRLQRVISQPLIELTETVRAVSQRKDYSIRAIPHGKDEIGFLTMSFNHMLEAIQSRDASLEQHREDLEKQVRARTTELRDRNDQLRESMEEARSAAVAKSQFLANMSHEIRTPMNGILGMNDLLLETPLTEQQKSYAEIVRGSAETLLEIINDILDFSKIEAGKLQLEEIEFSPSKAIEEVVGLLSGPARKKGLDLVCWLSPDVPRIMRGDPVRFRQVVTNLLGNAVKFTDQGRVSVRVDLAEGSESEALLRVEVQDTGIGIRPDRRDKLFRSFSQVDASTTRKFGGTGLGLAISRQLVELMGGEIGVKSEPGVGSVFWFTTRLGEIAEGRARSYVMPAGLEPPRVLIVDASAAVREVLHRQLEAWEIEHTVAVDQVRAREELLSSLRREEPFDLVLLDEEVDVEELRDCLVSEEESKAKPSIVLLSWGGTQLEERRMRTVRSVLSKPVRPSQLFDAVVEASHGELPDIGATDSPSPSPPEEALPAADQRGKLRILLAEDNRVNQLVAGKILERAGFKHDLAEDGGEVMQAIKERFYDVILMDCQMPNIDGFEATRRIRAWEAGLGAKARRTHIIALTANAMKGDRDRCLNDGMDDYLSKPVRPESLIQKLDELLGRGADGKARAA